MESQTYIKIFTPTRCSNEKCINMALFIHPKERMLNSFQSSFTTIQHRGFETAF